MHWEALKTQTAFTQTARLGVITDVDGTISPIVDVPDAAQVSQTARQHLTRLAAALPLVGVISGRGAADVRERVGVAGAVYVGNHGMERWRDGAVEIPPDVRAYRPNLEAAIARIESALVGIEGAWVEDKGATLSVHYRQAEDHDAVQARLHPVMAQIETAHDLRTFAGRMIYEVRPPIDTNKGSAFAALVREYDLTAAVYIGDDTTDIDALKSAAALRQSGVCYAVGVGVESAETPPAVIENADYTAQGIPDVEAFLGWLVALNC
ncbi:MAG: trehalose-phosphatase [Anaerolineaceae bacterium]|nr:MAG: trehalose-phosphatase [Anaerolineaceae bacterium]